MRRTDAGISVELGHVGHAGDAKHQGHHLIRKELAQLALGHQRVIKRVVEEARRDDFVIESKVC